MPFSNIRIRGVVIVITLLVSSLFVVRPTVIHTKLASWSSQSPPNSWHSTPKRSGTFTGTVGTSDNWSGLDSTFSGPYTQVSANWTVPAAKATNQATDSASWVGIDGDGSGSVLQGGTDSSTYSDGTPYYFAWMESYPSPATEIGTVSAGDSITCAVVQLSASSWQVTVTDNTSGQTTSTPFSYTSPNTSAEWITEDPSNAIGPLVLANYGTNTFTSMKMNSTPVDVSTLNTISMVQNGNTISYPTNITPGTNTFTDVYSAPPTTTTTTTAPATTTTAPAPTTTAPAPPAPARCDGTISAGVTSMAATADGQGYWIVSSLGQVVACGDAHNYGGVSDIVLNKPIVGIAPSANGYWLVGSDGGVFSFNAPFLGSTGNIHLNRPIVGISSALGGYRFVASDGGIFDFGLPFEGSAVAP